MAERIAALARLISAGLRAFTAVFAALNVALVAAIVLQVALRRGLGGGFVVLEELQWHLYAVTVMFGVVYSQTTDSHVRVDALSRKFSRNTRRVIEICGCALLFIPFCVVVFLHGLDFVHDSWRVNERSDSPVGLPARWLIKSVIPLTFGMLALAFAARILRDAAALGGAKDPDERIPGAADKAGGITPLAEAGGITPLAEAGGITPLAGPEIEFGSGIESKVESKVEFKVESKVGSKVEFKVESKNKRGDES